MKAVYHCLAGLSLLGSLTSGRRPVAAPAKEMRTLASGPMSGTGQARRGVARTPAELAKLWKLFGNGAPGARTPPRVDWKTEMVLAVFLGQRPSGGYSVEIQSVRPEARRLVVEVAERTPPPGTMSIQVLTTPFQVVAVRKSALPVVWKTVPAP
jgi:hypothetical protein